MSLAFHDALLAIDSSVRIMMDLTVLFCSYDFF